MVNWIDLMNCSFCQFDWWVTHMYILPVRPNWCPDRLMFMEEIIQNPTQWLSLFCQFWRWCYYLLHLWNENYSSWSQLYGRQNFLYQKAVLEGLCKLYFNKKIACPNPSWAHAFVSGLCFVGLVYLIKTRCPFVGNIFLVMQNHGHKSPHFVGDMLVKQKRVKWFYFAWALML